MYTKEQCLKNNKKTKKVKKTCKVYEATTLSGTEIEHMFNVSLEKDTDGWFKHLKMKAPKDSSWNKSLQNKTLIDIKYYDGNLVITMDYINDKKQYTMPLCHFYDLCAAGSVLNKLEDNRMVSKKKISKIKTFREE